MSGNGLEPRPQTLQLLARTRNSAAVKPLTVGLLSASPELSAQCVKLLMKRPELAAGKAVIAAWTRLEEEIRHSLLNCKVQLEKACKDTLKNGEPAEQKAAIVAVADMDMTAALPELTALALEPGNAVGGPAIECVLMMCDRWGQRAREGRDVPSVRGPMLDFMHRAISDFPKHGNQQIISAWLMLAGWEDSLQRSLINDPLHPAFRAVQEVFWKSQHRSILQLLGGYLWRSTTPRSVFSIIAERPEEELSTVIAEMVDEKLLPLVLRRLRELPPIASLSKLAARPSGTIPEVQRRLWLMMAANSPTLDAVIAGAVAFSKAGTVDGRRLAAAIIRQCRQPDMETLVQTIQVAEANPSDNRMLGAQLKSILTWVDGPSTILQAAAREFYADFSLSRLLDVTRKWPTPLCRVLARIVSRIDSDVIPQLLKELDSPAPRRRLCALQVIQLLEVTTEIRLRLLPLVDDSRVEVRVRAIDLLGALLSPELAEMLPSLLADPTTDIQDAAARAQRRLARKRRPATPIPVLSHNSPAITPLKQTH